jgi:hypothetical protein
MQINELITNKAWVADDGSYGIGHIAVFDDKLTDEQWGTLSELPDDERYHYVVALLNNDDVSKWEEN